MTNAKTNKLDSKAHKIVSAGTLFMCLLASLLYCYDYLIRVAPTVITADLMQYFSISNAGFGSFIAYYYYAYVPMQIPAGLLLDKYGPKLVLSISAFICCVGTVLFTLESLLLAKIGRFIVGFGSAFAYIGVLKIATIWLPKRYFAIVSGVASALGMLGAFAGIVVVEKLVSIFGWRQSFYISGGAGLLLSIMLYSFIQRRPASMLATANRKGRFKRGIIETIGAFKDAVKIKEVWLAGIIGCFAFLPLSVFAELWSVPFFESYGLSSSQAALGTSLVFIGFGCGGPFWGWLSEHMQNRKNILALGIGLSAIISFFLIWFTTKNVFVLYTLLFSLGFLCSVEILVFVVGNDVCDEKLSGTTAAFINMAVMTSGIILQPSVGFILDYLSIDAVAGYLDFQQALMVLPIGLAIGLFVVFSLKDTFNGNGGLTQISK